MPVFLLTFLAACGVSVNSGNSTDETDNNTGPINDTDTAPVDSGDTDTAVSTSGAWANVQTTYDADADTYLTEENANTLLAKITSGDVTDVPENVTDQIDAGEFDQDDNDKISYPGAPEVVDGHDNDGDGYAEVDPTLDATTYSADTTYIKYSKVKFADVNGDGFQDQIIANDYDSVDNTRDGSIKIYFGPNPGTTPNVTLNGGSYDAMLGQQLMVGDFDKDGMDDIAATGSLGYWDGAYVGGVILYYGRSDWTDAPTPYDMYGKDSSWFQTNKVGVITGDADEPLGGDIATAGDLDGDGADELLMERINTPIIDRIPQTANTSSGRYEGVQYVEDLEGRAWVKNTRSGIGTMEFTSGDYNADGIADLVTSVNEDPTGRGIVTLAYGPLSSAVDVNDTTPTSGQGLAEQGISSRRFRGENDGDAAGTIMTTGNFNGGADDLVIGAPQQGGYGRAYVITGDVLDSLPDGSVGETILDGPATAAGAVALVANSGDEFFPAAAGVGDMDGDGLDDLILASNRYDGQAGGMMLFSGAYLATLGGQEVSIDETSQIAQTQSSLLQSGFELGILGSPADHFATGDVDGDGAADLLSATADGNTYLFRGGYHGN